MGFRRGLGLAGAVAALALVLASCAQPNSGNTLGMQAVPAGHGNPLGIHPAGPANEPVCPGPVARGSAGCTSRVIINKQGKPSTSGTPQGYAPAQIQTAYGFSGVYGSNTGSGVTIAVVDAYDDPTAGADLGTFENVFNNGGTTPAIACKFNKYNQDGSDVGPYPHVDHGWALEISLDVQWACAMAPNATVDLVEANSSSFTDLLAAVSTAVNTLGANVVSMSWGGSELSSETTLDKTFASASNVTFTASSGDSGPGVVIWPAASPYVIGVGGTTLPLGNSDAYPSGNETVWSGSSGGISAVESEPYYQGSLKSTDAADLGGVLPASKRAVPDVAYDANPSTGFSVYDSTGYQGTSGWFVVGGTSAGSPQWAALFALADQGRFDQNTPLASLSGTTETSSGLTSPTYVLAGSSSSYSNDFHDITCSSSTGGGSGKGHGHSPKGGAIGNTSTGSTTCSGYDLTTGLGSPQAGALISALSSYAQ